MVAAHQGVWDQGRVRSQGRQSLSSGRGPNCETGVMDQNLHWTLNTWSAGTVVDCNHYRGGHHEKLTPSDCHATTSVAFAADGATRAIVLYVESIKDAR